MFFCLFWSEFHSPLMWGIRSCCLLTPVFGGTELNQCKALKLWHEGYWCSFHRRLTGGDLRRVSSDKDNQTLIPSKVEEFDISYLQCALLLFATRWHMDLFYFRCVIVTSANDAVTLERGNLYCFEIQSAWYAALYWPRNSFGGLISKIKTGSYSLPFNKTILFRCCWYF